VLAFLVVLHRPLRAAPERWRERSVARRSWIEVVLFMVAGAVNTVVTYALYLVLLLVLEYRIAFTIAFVGGILLAYTLNVFFVFRTRWSFAKLLGYPLIYLVQYGLGLGLLWIEVALFDVDRQLAPLVNALLLVPVTFALNRWFLRRKTDTQAPPRGTSRTP
jgi:putative flippase GtrA